MKVILKMLIVSAIFSITCNSQAQIKSNEEKPATETMPASQMKVAKMPTNMEKMNNACSNSNQPVSSNRKAANQNDKTNNTRKTIANETEKQENTRNTTANEIEKQDNPILVIKDTKKAEVLDSIIGEYNKKIIFNADIVRLYELEAPQKSQSTDYFKDFVILQERVLSKESAKLLTSLLLDEQNYNTGSFVKQCLFLPKMGVEFITDGGKTTRVLISVLCDVVHFYQDETTYHSINSDNGHDAILALYHDVFLTKAANLKRMSLTTDEQQPIFYTTKAGDSFSKIAREMSKEHNSEVTPDLLLQWNNYKNADKLAVGHQLIVGFKQENCE